ncbi:D-aminoacylase [bacterium]|nr:D-aminoacylase [bacterium]
MSFNPAPHPIRLSLFIALAQACSQAAVPAAADNKTVYDVAIRGGMVYDGSGSSGFRADLYVRADSIAWMGVRDCASARMELDASGLAVAPGFINMLSWADEALFRDGRSMSDIKQGVTLEIFGEGFSMGPLNDAMKKQIKADQSDIRHAVSWTTLGEYLDCLAGRGVSPNIASFAGATTVRIHELGYENRRPNPEELFRMTDLVRRAMEEGALGVSSALIYSPACFAGTDELAALAKAASDYGGLYISHIRSEGDRLLEAVDELIDITRRSASRSEIYHLKVAGRDNWHKIDDLIGKIETARSQGLSITADMYTYTAASTGLNACIPPWVQEGGFQAMRKRLMDPEVRIRVILDMNSPGSAWENFYQYAGDRNILFTGFRKRALRPFLGKTLAQVALLKNTDGPNAILDLVVEDQSTANAVYFIMNEDHVKRLISLPWVSFCSDARSMAAEGVFLQRSTHPRAYGAFARLLGKYVRDEGIITLQEAVRRLTSLPADNLRLRRRGRLAEGFFADVVVFDPAGIRDRATYEDPHQYAEGVVHVLVNGVPVLKNGRHTGAMPGRVLRGPGWKGLHGGVK